MLFDSDSSWIVHTWGQIWQTANYYSEILLLKKNKTAIKNIKAGLFGKSVTF